jgi:hypothetical protein
LEAKLAAANVCQSQLAQLQSQCDTEFRKAQQLPEKAARQSRTVETLSTQLRSQYNKLQGQCEASDALIAKEQEELQNLETDHATLMVEVERGQYATEAQAQSVCEVQKQYHLKQFEAEQILAVQVGVALGCTGISMTNMLEPHLHFVESSHTNAIQMLYRKQNFAC